MAKSAFDVHGECSGEHCDMEAGSIEHGHAMHTRMTKHAKGGHKRGFFGKGGKVSAAQGAGEGMSGNEKGNKSTGKKKEPMQSHGEY